MIRSVVALAKRSLALFVAVAGCSSSESTVSPTPADGGTTDAPSSTSVTIAFVAQVGEVPFRCSQTYPGLGTVPTTIAPLDFRFYVYDVRLIRADGTDVPVSLQQDGKWQYENLVLLDFEDNSGTCLTGTAETNAKVVGSVPAATYKGLKFGLGVPFALNHQNQATAPSPLNLSALFWSWQSGYKFLRIDGKKALDADAGLSDAGATIRYRPGAGRDSCPRGP